MDRIPTLNPSVTFENAWTICMILGHVHILGLGA